MSGSHPSVLLVLGCTGVGKTKLGVSLARRFDGEVISCDSIQVYDGMPIASNQCTVEEAHGVRQHCMSVVAPWRAMHVHGFRRAAKALIKEIHARGRNVIIVGGTFYWLESILYKTIMNIDEEEQEEDAAPKSASTSGQPDDTAESAEAAVIDLPAVSLTLDEWKQYLQSLGSASVARVPFVRRVLLSEPAFASAHLFEVLSLVDASSACKLHPNNLRKVHRALEVFVEHDGRTQSELVAETGGSKGSTGLQYRVQAIWLDCDTAVLDQRLDRRIDDMITRGLIDEVDTIYRQLWQRQQRMTQARDQQTNDEEWRYACPLDPDCGICSRIESRDSLAPLAHDSSVPPSASVSALAASTADPSAASPSSYLGPAELQFDWERGVGQALGFKEFRPYFTMKFHTPAACDSTGPANDSAEAASSSPPRAAKKQKVSHTDSTVAHAPTAASSTPTALSECIARCVASLKSRTRSYARVQSRWIKSRLWTAAASAPRIEDASDAASNPSTASSHLPILRLDASVVDAETWSRAIEAPAMEVCAAFLAGNTVDLAPYAHFASNLPEIPAPATQAATLPVAVGASSASDPRVAASSVPWQKYTCDVCVATCNGSLEWSRHLTSRKHRTRATSDERKAKQMEQQAEVQRQRQAKKEAAAAAVAAAAATSTSEATDAAAPAPLSTIP